MPFPRKFKDLLEATLDSVEKPDFALLTYAVCGCESASCGWAGWILEGAFRDDPTQPSEGRILPGDYEQKCPRCGKSTFRTEATVELRLADDQSRVEIGTDNVAEIEYED